MTSGVRAMEKIRYKSGYKYQLAEPYKIQLPIKPSQSIDGDYYSLGTSGILMMWRGYAWNGASGAIDTKNFMRGSAVHDALYQMIAEGQLPDSYRDEADDILIQICKEDGMSWIRRQWVYKAVRWFGDGAAHTKQEIQEAP